MRWVEEVTDLLRMGLKIFKSPRPDRMLALSSPPGLVLLAAMGAIWHRCRLGHWVMDVYPEVALAGRLLRKGILADMIRWLFARSYRRCHSVIALDEDMAEVLSRSYAGSMHVHPPWPPSVEGSEPFSGWDGVPEGHMIWLYSGNLGRAHLWEPLIRAQALIESESEDIHLIIQGSGMGWEKARKAVVDIGLHRCHCTGYVPRAQLVSCLMRANLHVVTQAPEMCGLIWPSKLALLNELKAPLIWVGPGASHLTRTLRARPHTWTHEPGEVEALAGSVMQAIGSGQKCRQELGCILQRIESSRRRSIESLAKKMGLTS